MLSTETTNSAPTSGPSIGSIELLMGAAVAVAADGSERGVVVGDALYEGEVVKVDGQSTVEIRLGDNSLHRLSADGIPAGQILLAQNDIGNVPDTSDAALELRAVVAQAVRQAVSENRGATELVQSVEEIEALPPPAAGELTEAVLQAVSQNSSLSELLQQFPDDVVAAVIDELPVEIALRVIEELPPPAAGELSDGHSFVVIPLDLPLLTPQAGFETQGLGFAFPEGIPGGGLPVFAPPEVVSVASLHLEKDATVPGGAADVVGETINYTLAVTNTGNAEIAGVVVDDPFTTDEAPVLNGTFNVGDIDSDGLLDVNEVWQYTASHTVTQAELDAGTNIVNTATVTGTGATPDDDGASVPVAQNKILHLEKDATVPGGTADVVGETINYTLAVTNTGNAAIANVVVDDPFTTDEAPVLNGAFNVGDTDQDGLLDVNEVWQYTATHTVTQDELDVGSNIVNTATVTGTGATPDDDGASVPMAQNKILHLEKDATVPGGTADVVGETINYTLAVTNTGNAAIAGVVVDDPFTTDEAPVLNGGFNAGDLDSDGLLDVTETWQYTATHTVTQDELDVGTNIVNTATVTGTGATPDSDDASVLVPTKILHLEKDATVPGGTADVVGETINYTLAVTNTGNAAIADVVVDDPFTADEAPVLNGAFNVGDIDSDGLLDVNEVWQYTASHTVTQDELDVGSNIVNTATVTGTGAIPDDDGASVPVDQNPTLTIVKSADAGQTADVAGEKLTYTITVANTGNLTLSGVTVTDPNADPGSIVRGPDLSGDNDALLEVGETWSYTAAHTVTQAEIDNNGGGDGDIDNVATANSNESGPDSDDATVPVQQNQQNAALTIVKSADAGQTADVAGEKLTYTITVANAGSQTLSGVTVTDPNADPGSIVRGPDLTGDNDALLEVGETWSYVAAHTVTQTEIDNNGGGDGDIDNVATADSNESGPDSDDATVPVQQNAALTIVKSADAGQTADVAGEKLTYTITVANAGNQTLSGVTVTDPNADPGSIVRGPDLTGDNDALLEVGETWSYVAAHTVTQTELDNNGGGDGDIDNVATADSNESGPDSDDATVPVQQNAALTIVKSADAGQTADVAGEKLTYTITVANAGSQTLSGVTVTDPNADPGSIVRGPDLTGDNDALLEVGETWSYVAAHTVTQTEIDNNGGGDGDIDNVATADSNESGPDSDDATVPVQQNAALTIVKSADAGQTADVAGEKLTYTITVANAGNQTLSGVTVTDPNADPGSIVRGPDLTGDDDALLEVGEIWSYVAAHTVTQTELDNNGGGDGDIDNVATANSTESGPDSDDASVPVVTTLSIDDVQVREGDPRLPGGPDVTDATITFTFTRGGNTSGETTVTYTVKPDSALTPDDYSDDPHPSVVPIDDLNGTVTFAPGETTKSITLNITDDNVGIAGAAESIFETFTVELSPVPNATFVSDLSTGNVAGPGVGTGTIKDDDFNEIGFIPAENKPIPLSQVQGDILLLSNLLDMGVVDPVDAKNNPSDYVRIDKSSGIVWFDADGGVDNFENVGKIESFDDSASVNVFFNPILNDANFVDVVSVSPSDFP